MFKNIDDSRRFREGLPGHGVGRHSSSKNSLKRQSEKHDGTSPPSSEANGDRICTRRPWTACACSRKLATGSCTYGNAIGWRRRKPTRLVRLAMLCGRCRKPRFNVAAARCPHRSARHRRAGSQPPGKCRCRGRRLRAAWPPFARSTRLQKGLG
jgi:hypothetical protein